MKFLEFATLSLFSLPALGDSARVGLRIKKSDWSIKVQVGTPRQQLRVQLLFQEKESFTLASPLDLSRPQFRPSDSTSFENDSDIVKLRGLSWRQSKINFADVSYPDNALGRVSLNVFETESISSSFWSDLNNQIDLDENVFAFTAKKGKRFMDIGRIDPARYTGELTFLPVFKKEGFKKQWNIELDVFNGETKLGTRVATFRTDQMTNFISEEDASQFADEINGRAPFGKAECDTKELMGVFPTLSFRIPNGQETFTLEADLYSDSERAKEKGREKRDCFVDTIPFGENLADIELGQKFFEKYFVVFDFTPGSEKVGIALAA